MALRGALPLTARKIGPWKGMNERIHPSQLPPGIAASAQNVLFDEIPGEVVTRQGKRVLAALPSGLAPRDSYEFAKLDGTSYMIVSDGSSIYATTDPTVTSAYVLIASGLDADGFMSFETAEDKLWLSNGIDNVQSWDGTTLIIYDRTYTNTTDASAVSGTTITHAGLTGATDYWKNRKLVFTNGANLGTVVTITAYNSSTHALTFTPSLSGVATTDRWVVGVVIPSAAVMRYWDTHLFMGATASNVAELRTNTRSDPNTGAFINLDHPLAWPAQDQLNINILDQEKIWGISPIIRDRALVMKGNSLYRLERDALVLYRPEVVSRAIGSRFPDTWAEKNGLLYFVGQDRDGYPNVFKTDMVDVQLADPDGGVEPTLRGLQQANQLLQNKTFASQADYDAGTKSTLVNDAAGLGILGTIPPPTAAANLDTARPDGSVGYHGLLGIPQWDGKWDGRTGLLPSAATPAWTMLSSPGTNGVWNAIANGVLTDTGSGSGEKSVSIAGVFSPTQNAILSVECDMAGEMFLQVANGAKSAWIQFWGGQFFYLVGESRSEGHTFSFNPALSHVFTIQLLTTGQFNVWVDGVLLVTGTALNSSSNKARFGPSVTINFGHGGQADFSADPTLYVGGSGGSGYYKRAYYAASSNGAPNAFLLTGSLTAQYDYTRAPDALHRLYCAFNPDTYLARCTTTTASLTVQLSSAVDMTVFANGQTVNLRTEATGALIANGSGRVIQAVDAVHFTITLDAGGGNVSTDATVGVYGAQTGIVFTTWSSDTVDFSAGNDAAGYLPVTNGNQPTSAVKRYLRVQLALTFPDLMTSTTINNLYAGILWISPAVNVGGAISAWRTFLATLTTPAGVDQTIKIRRATIATAPAEGDWGAWLTIANGNNTGTILSDTGSPPTSRWVQLKVEEGPSAVGLLPIVTSLVVQWTQGSTKNLPIRASVHKRRYIVTAASALAAFNDTIVVLDRNDQWTKFAGMSLNGLMHYKGALYGLECQSPNVSILDVDGVYDDAGVAIDAYVVTREEDFNAPHLRKNCRYSYLHTGRAPVPYNLDVSYQRSGDVAFSTPVTLSFGTTEQDVRQNFPVGTVAKRIQRKYRNNVLGQHIALMGETFYYDVRPAQPA